ncbi:MAG: hypothetical protein VX589_07305, partial [Myxococcota bacterium]|nr:hypothetical protein [Myxococcota bacterium]
MTSLRSIKGLANVLGACLIASACAEGHFNGDTPAVSAQHASHHPFSDGARELGDLTGQSPVAVHHPRSTATETDGRTPPAADHPRDLASVSTQPGCAQLIVTEPKPDATASDGIFTVRGHAQGATASGHNGVDVAGRMVALINDEFEAQIHRPPGRHTLVVRCGEYAHRIGVTSGQDEPRIHIESPAPGLFIKASAEPVRLTGRVETLVGIDSLMLGDVPIKVGPTGRFEHLLSPTEGMNHVHLTLTTMEGLTTNRTRSFIYGQFRPFDENKGSAVFARLSPSGLNVISAALERQLDDGLLEDALEPFLKRHGDLQLHEFKYRDLDIDTQPIDGGLRIRIAINDFRLKFTYHYKVFGFVGGRVRGWAKARPLDLEAKVMIGRHGQEDFRAHLQDSKVELRRFDLDLNDLYSVVEGLIQPMVKDMGHDAIRKALDKVVIDQILRVDLLHQDVNIMGKTATMSMTIEHLICQR